MNLFADSGSTKTEWILTENEKVVFKKETKGLNPFYLTKNMVRIAIESLALNNSINQIRDLYFYSAGCSSEDKKQELNHLLQQSLPHTNIHVDTDINGAVIACVNPGEAAFVSILGTGSTFRYYNGESIEKKYSSLGFILGDEGSGTAIAKQLLKGIFYENLPKEIRDDFFSTYKLVHQDLLDNIYKNDLPNRYLASFVPFCKKHIEHPAIKKIILDSFQVFFDQHLNKYKENHQKKIHFVGSIAFHFKDELNEIAMLNHFEVGTILQKPLEMIVKKHSI